MFTYNVAAPADVTTSLTSPHVPASRSVAASEGVPVALPTLNVAVSPSVAAESIALKLTTISSPSAALSDDKSSFIPPVLFEKRDFGNEIYVLSASSAFA